MNKKIITLIAFCITLMTFAQAPDFINYQAIIRNSDGNLVQDSNIGMRVSILQTNATGTAVYTETHTASTNTNGLVTIMIGGGTSSDDFSTIDWSNGPYFIKTETDVAGGTNYTITGTSQLLSVPYALYAKTAGSVEGSGSTNTNNPLNLNNNTSFAFKSSDENKVYAWSNQGSWSSVSYTNTAYGAGSLIASNGNFAFKANDDNKMYAWSFVTYNWTSVDYTNTAYGASSITASNGNFIFKASDDNMYYVWNAEDGVWTGTSYPNTNYGAGNIVVSPHNEN